MSSKKALPWAANKEQLTTLLFQLVLSKRAHVALTKNVKQLWNEINDAFYDNDILVNYKADHYKKDDFRKIREYYTKRLNEIIKDKETGNQSGKSDELSELYEYAKQIYQDLELKEEQKLTEKLNKEKLANATTVVIDSDTEENDNDALFAFVLDNNVIN